MRYVANYDMTKDQGSALCGKAAAVKEIKSKVVSMEGNRKSVQTNQLQHTCQWRGDHARAAKILTAAE